MELIENPFRQPLLLIAVIFFWGGILAFVLALFQVGTIRRAIGLWVVALLLFAIQSCIN